MGTERFALPAAFLLLAATTAEGGPLLDRLRERMAAGTQPRRRRKRSDVGLLQSAPEAVAAA